MNEEMSIHTEILEELSLWLGYGTLLYARLGAVDLAMRVKFVLVSLDDVTSVTSRAVTLYFFIIIYYSSLYSITNKTRPT